MINKVRGMSITVVLVAIITLLFGVIWLMVSPIFIMTPEKLLMGGAFYGPLVDAGQWWRLLTAGFMQGNIFQLLINVFVFLQIGYLTENIFGRTRYLIILLGSAIVSNVVLYCAYRFFGYSMISFGAGGMLFGLFGAVLAMSILYQDQFGPLIRMIAPSIVFVVLLSIFFMSGTLMSYLGGFFGGFLITGIISYIAPLRY